MNSQEVDFRSLDWDDTELIKAYDKGMERRKSELNRLKNGGKIESSKKTAKKEWKVGDFCRAIYSIDQQYYEARVTVVECDYCLVQFLGYGDQEELPMSALKESLGKKARKKQIKAAKDFHLENSSVLGSGTDTNEETSTSQGARPKVKEMPNPSAPPNFKYPGRPFPSFRDAASFPPPPPPSFPSFFDHPFTGPFIPPPPEPPMPQQFSSITQDPAFTAMITSWYMSGYYTGVYQGQKMAQCPRRCCARADSCYH